MGSINQEATRNFYSSPYLAEHYDLLCANEGAFYKDIDVFWTELNRVRELKRTKGEDPDQLVVVDVGTGTGRALDGLVKCAKENEVDLSRCKFVGFDLSQDMVDRAAKTRNMSAVGTTIWHCASAVDLDRVMAAYNIEQRVDLILFADGGFLHLEEQEEAQKFLQCLQKVALQPGTGRACISITNQNSVQDGKDLNFIDSSGAVQEYKSVEYPGLLYRNSFVSSTKQGASQIMTSRFEVLRTKENGDHELIETHLSELRGRAWKDSEVADLIAGTEGLETRDVIQPDSLQTFFIVSREA
ncbi:uncharacterized protein N7511_003904 [Penicillium nucicola]|uniref:uncharacterized protein n=1 Tax=Penicillium nucicola TaxID=1850975 RepID=UPI002545B14A|nr:uncharacterized protein N7511_003904 [Penicillium nucicola]KAJ5766288.1 hypothetical protein N7511_003904 [Penicillium nucicola]